MGVELSQAVLEEAERLLEMHTDISELAETVSIEAAGSRLNRLVEPEVENLTVGPYWTSVKKEFFVLLCTNERRYDELRKSLTATERTTKTVIVPVIAGAIGATLSLASGILVPFVALTILGVAQIGTRAWCANAKNADVLQFVELNGAPLKKKKNTKKKKRK